MKRTQKVKGRRRRSRRRGADHFRDLIAANAILAAKDESYTHVVRIVEELMRDPELAEKIEYYTRQIFRALAAKLKGPPRRRRLA